MNLKTLISILESIAPLELAYDFDKGKIGLILERSQEIKKIAISLDPTDNVLKEASRIGADLLITHHTLIFNPVSIISKQLSDTLKIAIDNDISIYTMHTNYDRADNGINDVLSEILGLKNIIKLELGRIGEIEPLSASMFASFVSKKLNTHVMYLENKTKIKKVMVVGGSGFKEEYIELANYHEVDAFVSGDLKHNILLYSKGLSLFDATHYATESPAMKRLCNRLPIESVFIEDKPKLNHIKELNNLSL